METRLHDVLIGAKEHVWYQECLARVRALEPGFLEIRAGLSPEKQELLDRYIAACEAMDDALLMAVLQKQ